MWKLLSDNYVAASDLMRIDVHKTFALNIADEAKININCKCSSSHGQSKQKAGQNKLNLLHGQGFSGSNLEGNLICRWLNLALSWNSHRNESGILY